MNKPIDVSLFFDQSKVCGMICKICSGVYFNPTIDECGHIFCSTCFTDRMKVDQTCPVTKKQLEKIEGGPVSFVENILNKQTLNCPENCGWIGIFSELLHHLKNYCEEATDRCKFEGCDYSDRRRLVVDHKANCSFRVLTCQQCSEVYKHFEQDDHRRVCPFAQISCPNSCGVHIERVKMRSHLDTCPLETIDCYYCDFGCKKQLLRKDLFSHLKSFENEHKKARLTRLAIFENQVKTQFDSLKIENHSLNKEIDELNGKSSIYPYFKRRETDHYEVKKILNRKKKGGESKFSLVALNQKEFLQVRDLSAKYFGKETYCYGVVDRPITEISKWKVKFSLLTKYAGVGVVQEEKFLKAKESKGNSSTDNGLIVFSNSGFTWNYEKKEKIGFTLNFEENEWIEFEFDKQKSNLTIKVGDTKRQITVKDSTLKPLFILMGYNDEVEVSLEN